MSQWVGQSISVECSNDMVYQGVVSSVSSDSTTVILDHAFRNGKPCGAAVSIRSADILNLEFIQPTQLLRKPYIESSDDDGNRASGHYKKPAHHHKKTNAHRPSITPEAKQPEKADIVSLSVMHRRRSSSLTSADYNKSDITDNTYLSAVRPPMHKRHHRPEAADCFAVSVESCQDDFDFETNLALFDKQQVYGEIENGKRTPNKHNKHTQSNYKHDEMILKPKRKPQQQIKLLDLSQATGYYSTDDGLLIPCIDLITREKLFLHAASYGFSEQRRVDMVGRNTSDMVFQLIGGSSRLNQQNTHQKPTVLVLVGSHIQGCYGVSCARHLANHNVNTLVFSSKLTQLTSTDLRQQLFDGELTLYSMCGNKIILDAQDLPTSTVDLIINCLDGGSQISKERTTTWYRYIANWCNTSRARVLAIDPPVEGCVIETKWSVHIGLPQMLDKQSTGQTYLCDIGLPRDIFKCINVKYRSPFSVKFCIPLHNQ